MAKRPKYGGRKKGTPNRETVARLERDEKNSREGITPLQVMLRTMRHLWKDAEAIDEKTGAANIINPEKAMAAMAVADRAAPYCHARIAAKEEIPPPPPTDEEIDLYEASRRIAFTLAVGMRGPQKVLPKPPKRG